MRTPVLSKTFKYLPIIFFLAQVNCNPAFAQLDPVLETKYKELMTRMIGSLWGSVITKVGELDSNYLPEHHSTKVDYFIRQELLGNPDYRPCGYPAKIQKVASLEIKEGDKADRQFFRLKMRGCTSQTNSENRLLLNEEIDFRSSRVLKIDLDDQTSQKRKIYLEPNDEYIRWIVKSGENKSILKVISHRKPESIETEFEAFGKKMLKLKVSNSGNKRSYVGTIETIFKGVDSRNFSFSNSKALNNWVYTVSRDVILEERVLDVENSKYYAGQGELSQYSESSFNSLYNSYIFDSLRFGVGFQLQHLLTYLPETKSSTVVAGPGQKFIEELNLYVKKLRSGDFKYVEDRLFELINAVMKGKFVIQADNR